MPQDGVRYGPQCARTRRGNRGPIPARHFRNTRRPPPSPVAPAKGIGRSLGVASAKLTQHGRAIQRGDLAAVISRQTRLGFLCPRRFDLACRFIVKTPQQRVSQEGSLMRGKPHRFSLQYHLIHAFNIISMSARGKNYHASRITSSSPTPSPHPSSTRRSCACSHPCRCIRERRRRPSPVCGAGPCRRGCCRR